MLNFTNATLLNIVVHFAGNKSLGNELVISDSYTEIPKKHEADVLNFMVSAFKNSPSNEFTHVSELSLNPMFNYSSRIFENNSTLLSQSKSIAKHLYNISNHSGIKDGELIIALVDNLYFDDEVVSGLAIVKSESKNKFFKTAKSANGVSFKVEDGISADKIDKGCLILNTNYKNGFAVFVIDKTNTGEEAQFWTKQFLDIKESNDSFHNTKTFLSMCKTFIQDELPGRVDIERTEQIELLNKSVSYFRDNESLNAKAFSNTVLKEPQVIKAFNRFKEEYADGSLQDAFEISPLAVKQQSKNFKSVLKLDKNFHVYVHGDRALIENGFDEAKGLKYYKLYYKDEA